MEETLQPSFQSLRMINAIPDEKKQTGDLDKEKARQRLSQTLVNKAKW